MPDPKFYRLDIAPGEYSEETAAGAMGRWKDLNRVRFRNGLAEKLGGWQSRTLDFSNTPLNAAGNNQTILGFARALWDWTSLDGRRYVAVGTNLKLYLITEDTVYDITPVRSTGTLGSNPFAATIGSNIITVTHTSHGAGVGDFVRFTGATTFQGIPAAELNAEHQILTVPSTNTYTIAVVTNATGTGSGGGASVGFTYDINTSPADATVSFGYGTCNYGQEGYGTIRTLCAGVPVRLQLWSLDNWGEDLVANQRGGAMYHWDKTGGETTRAVLITGTEVPDRVNRILVAPDQRQLVALGAEEPITGNRDPQIIRVSAEEDFTNFDPTNTAARAVDKRLTRGSEILTGVATRGGILVWTDTTVYFMRFVANPNVIDVPSVGEGSQIAGPNAGADVNGVMYYMATGNFMVYDGVLRVLPCAVWEKVFRNINTEQIEKVVCSRVRDFSEVWWLYPSALSLEPDRYVAYNHEERLWHTGALARVGFHDYSPVWRQPYGFDSAGTLYLHELGYSDDGASMGEYIESFDFDIADGEQVIAISAAVPDFKQIGGASDLFLKARKWPQGPQRMVGPKSIDSTTQRVGIRIRGRQVALRVEGTGSGEFWRMGTWKLEGQPDGER